MSLAREQQYSTLMEHLLEPIYTCNEDGQFTYVNVAFEKLTGYYRSQLLGLSYRDLLTDETGDRCDISPSFSEEPRQYRCVIHTKAGQKRWIDATILSLVQDGHYAGFTGMMKSVDQKCDRDREIRSENERKLELLFRNAQEGVSISDLSGAVVQVNAAWETLYGWTSEEIVGKQNPVLSEQEFDSIKEKLFEGESIPLYETTLHRKDGTRFSAVCSFYPIEDSYGNIIEIVGSTRDITDLRDAENRYSLIAKNSSDLIRLINKDGIATFVSPSHKWILDMEWQSFLGKSYLFGVHPDDAPLLTKQFELVFKTRKSFLCEYRRQHRNGHYFWVETTGTPVFDEKQNVTRVVMVSRDITKRKKYEQQLEFLAFHDPLTRLPNRRLFVDRTKQATKEAKRTGKRLAVLFLDCDQFKRINDNYGHDIGDELIREFGRRLQHAIREIDTAARMGGDEFVVLLPQLSSREDVEGVVDRIFNELNAPWQIHGSELQLTTSMGIALYPDDAKDAQALITCSDRALYSAKEAGKDTYRFS